MSYLDQFELLIEDEKFSSFLQLWEEYCQGDQAEGKEFNALLKLIKNSPFATPFGKLTETALALWQKIQEPEEKYQGLRHILDLQTTHSPVLAELALKAVEERFKDHKDFSEMLRITGLRGRHSFQKAISSFELLCHMKKGAFVFHTGGWGVGEVMDFSLLQEHVVLEFEGIQALKDITFENAFKNLEPLPHDHFLSRRFGNPDLLETEGKKDPLRLIHLLLKDLGKKTAQEIKEELCELVIPEEEWVKWWQAARAKLKKDTKVRSPKSSKEPFVLLEEEVPHDVQLINALKKDLSPDSLITTIYNHLRDFPEITKNKELKEELKERLEKHLSVKEEAPHLTMARKLQATFLLQDLYPKEYVDDAKNSVMELEHAEQVLNYIEVVALKKRMLIEMRKNREDWKQLFLQLLFVIPQNQLREYLFKELQKADLSEGVLKAKIGELLHNVTLFPEAFFWYFQKLPGKESVPYQTEEDQRQFLEALMVLLHFIDNKEDYKDLSKKIYNYLVAKRYLVVRQIIENASLTYLKEFLLLASKCLCFSKQDLSILRSLAEVVHPALSTKSEEESVDEVIWTTADGFHKLQERIKEIGTIEMLDNAKEIEEARSHGDLRENSEYKYALERRSRLQAELSTLSKQMNHARVITQADIRPGEVGPGMIVKLVNSKGSQETYTLLGPWDADPDKKILSCQSKFAQAMSGRKKGEKFSFQGEEYAVQDTKSFFE
jgi:transcription elongation factor GreA-like protein/transcription elongation GreA/GreB family factor